MDKLTTQAVATTRHKRVAYLFYRLAWATLDWLYPPNCGGCDRRYARWCLNCQNQVQIIMGSICDRCGGWIDEHGQCNCIGRHVPYDALRSWASYQGPLRKAILRLKYASDLALGEILSRPMISKYQEMGWHVDLVVPVPGSLARKKARGYNQAALLAFPIALSVGLPYSPKALIKVRDTRTQVGLSPFERRQNVAQAFLGKKEIINGKKVLVVDDVTTSGATMEACAEALLAQGASQVFGLTLARTVLDYPVSS